MLSPEDLQQIRKALRKDLKKIIQQELARAESPLLRVDGTASYLNVKERSFRNRLGPRAKCPFPVRPLPDSGPIRFRKSDLDEYIRDPEGYAAKRGGAP